MSKSLLSLGIDQHALRARALKKPSISYF